MGSCHSGKLGRGAVVSAVFLVNGLLLGAGGAAAQDLSPVVALPGYGELFVVGALAQPPRDGVARRIRNPRHIVGTESPQITPARDFDLVLGAEVERTLRGVLLPCNRPARAVRRGWLRDRLGDNLWRRVDLVRMDGECERLALPIPVMFLSGARRVDAVDEVFRDRDEALHDRVRAILGIDAGIEVFRLGALLVVKYPDSNGWRWAGIDDPERGSSAIARWNGQVLTRSVVGGPSLLTLHIGGRRYAMITADGHYGLLRLRTE